MTLSSASLRPSRLKLRRVREEIEKRSQKTLDGSRSCHAKLTSILDEMIQTVPIVDAVKDEMALLGVDESFMIGGGEGVTKAPSIRDFEILKPISKGAYGRVFLAQKVTTRDVFAIKVLKRSDALTTQQRDTILLEVSFDLGHLSKFTPIHT